MVINIRFLLLCLVCLSIIGCSNSKQKFVIEGTFPSVKYDGEWIYLVPMEKALGRVDSVKITHASFRFVGEGEEIRVLRLRYALRPAIQELLVVTEPGIIHVKADSIGSVTGTPQNNALQEWKTMKEHTLVAYRSIRVKWETATKSDSLHTIHVLDSLLAQERNANFLFLQKQKKNTLGVFMQRMLDSSLTKEQQRTLDENQ